MNRNKPFRLTFVLAIAGAVALWYVATASFRGTAPFSIVEWRDLSHTDRAAMARDLVESQVLIGKSKDEVIAELGAPDLESRYVQYAFDDIGRLMLQLDEESAITKVIVTQRTRDLQSMTFRQKVWDMGNPEARILMALDLETRGALNGKTLAEAEYMLGRPTDFGQYVAYHVRGASAIGGSSTPYLVVSFGRDGRVNDARPPQ